MFFLFIAVVGLVSWLEVRWLIHRFRGREDREFWPAFAEPFSRGLTRILNVVAVVGLLCVLWGWLVEPRWVSVTEVRLESAKIKPETGRVRIVQLSDFHSEAAPLNELKAVGIVNSLQPDIVVFTGDYLNTPQGLGISREAFRGLKPRYGTFLVSGNYDLGMVPEGAFKDAGVVELESGSREVAIRGSRIRVTGLSILNAPDFRYAMGLLRAEPAYDVFLFHYTDLVDEAAKAGVDLYLAGHTHGGQVRLPFYGALVTLSSTGKKFESGLYRLGSMALYVNRGLGLEGGLAPRVRFLCRPEITVIDVYPDGVRP
ncbi:MAG: metallophosphoesterase [Elusimicrobiota bacterium]|jgi:hypothetical protein